MGRPPVPTEIKALILDMKNRNLYLGYKRIQGELLKLGIKLDKKTIWNICESSRHECDCRAVYQISTEGDTGSFYYIRSIATVLAIGADRKTARSMHEYLSSK